MGTRLAPFFHNTRSCSDDMAQRDLWPFYTALYCAAGDDTGLVCYARIILIRVCARTLILTDGSGSGSERVAEQ